ncbi:hypothetical protein BH11PLA2_BH11PLA2_32620 [soil metagenome]
MSETVSSVEKSPSIAALAGALAAAQIEMRNPVKDSVNPHFNSKYAALAAVRDAVMPILGKHKLSVVQLPTETATGPALVSILLHSSGEFIQSTLLLRAMKMDPQGIGSSLTYARRYALQSIAGVAAEDDDDGNAASRVHDDGQHRSQQPQQQPRQQQQPESQHDDREIVDMIEAGYRQCCDKAEFRMFTETTVKPNKAKLSPAGTTYLKSFCETFLRSLPEVAPQAQPQPATRTDANGVAHTTDGEGLNHNVPF